MAPTKSRRPSRCTNRRIDRSSGHAHSIVAICHGPAPFCVAAASSTLNEGRLTTLGRPKQTSRNPPRYGIRLPRRDERATAVDDVTAFVSRHKRADGETHQRFDDRAGWRDGAAKPRRAAACYVAVVPGETNKEKPRRLRDGVRQSSPAGGRGPAKLVEGGAGEARAGTSDGSGYAHPPAGLSPSRS